MQDLQFNAELREIRKSYVDSLNRFIHGECTESEISKVSNLYRNELSNIIHPQTKFKIIPRACIGLGLSAIASTTPMGYGGVVAVSLFLNRFGGKVFSALIDSPNVKNALSRQGIKAILFKESGKMARDLGLINAKLDTVSANKYLEDIPRFNPNL